MLRVCAWCLVPALLFLGCVPIRPPEVAAAPAGAGQTSPAAVADAAHAQDPGQEEFEARVLPILLAKCSPCHFEGGKMYARLPFDRPGTIRVLGTALFTRLRDEEERQTIRDFLGIEAPSPEGAGAPADGERTGDPPLPR